MKKRVQIEEIKRLFESYERLTVKELSAYTNLAERTVRDYLKILMDEELVVAIGATNKRYYQRNYAIDEKPIVVMVLQNGTEVGTLSFSYAKGYLFSYVMAYRGGKLPSLSEHINESYALFPIFENLIPESRRRDRLLLKDGRVLNPLLLLLELDNTHGSFDFLPLVSLENKAKTESYKIPSWGVVKHTILGNNDFVNLINYRLEIPLTSLKGTVKSRELYSSLSGYQHKIDVNIDAKAKTIRRIKRDKGELAHYLLKPYASDRRIKHTPYLALNEHLFMSFAKNELGLDVPLTAVLLGTNQDFYFLVKRYDRYRGYKYHQYDFAQLLNIESEEKYDVTIVDILKRFSELVCDKKSKEEIYRFLIYSSLIKHGDLHAKNIGLIEIREGKWVLAPLYDIISTYVYEGKKSDDFGIAFDTKESKKRGLDYQDYMQMAEILNLKPSKAKAILKDTIKRFQIYFPNYIKATKAFEKELGYRHLLSKKLRLLYNHKNMEFEKLGILDEVELKTLEI